MNTRFGILRFVAYAMTIAAVAWLVAFRAMHDAGGLRLAAEVTIRSHAYITSEQSLVEWLQNLLLVVCILVFAWVGLRDRLRRPMAVMFIAVFSLALIRELDFYLDHQLVENLWQVLSAITAILATVYLVRHRRRLVSGWQRSWPSAGLSMVMGGLMLLLPFTQILAQPAIWKATLGEHYSRAALLGFEELSELGAYLLITIGVAEFLYAWSRLPITREMDRPRRRRRPRQR